MIERRSGHIAIQYNDKDGMALFRELNGIVVTVTPFFDTKFEVQ